jgi:hypothetical protein
MHLFGQRGIPASLRHINAFSVHTYTLTKTVRHLILEENILLMLFIGWELSIRQMVVEA